MSDPDRIEGRLKAASPGASHDALPASRVAIIGRANVGKSTLLNVLSGEKIAIVSPVPQTTRIRLVGDVVHDGCRLVFVDCPGIHKPQHRLGRLMVETAYRVLGEANVIVFVIDAAEGIGPGDRYVQSHVLADVGDTPIVFVPNKIDVMNKGRLLPMIDVATSEWGCVEAVPVSAETGENCDRLLDVLVAHAASRSEPYHERVIDGDPERTFAAEIIREKLLHQLRKELPHAIAVKVDSFERRDDGLVAIHASIFVERKSQRGIVIGRGGDLLKQVGTQARLELEARWETKVFIELWVKVREGWRQKLALLRELGVYPG